MLPRKSPCHKKLVTESDGDRMADRLMCSELSQVGTVKEIEMNRHIEVPFLEASAASLRAGDCVYLTGILYTARDATHKRMYEALERNESLPFDIRDGVIYYMGPSPARPGRVIGSAGPTTSSRMDKYAPILLDMGLKGMIGKGRRSQGVKDAVKRNGAVYFAAVGGAGALLSRSIVGAEVIAYEDLGTEAVRRLKVREFPVIVVADAEGNDLYDTAAQRYCREATVDCMNIGGAISQT